MVITIIIMIIIIDHDCHHYYLGSIMGGGGDGLKVQNEEEKTVLILKTHNTRHKANLFLFVVPKHFITHMLKYTCVFFVVMFA